MRGVTLAAHDRTVMSCDMASFKAKLCSTRKTPSFNVKPSSIYLVSSSWAFRVACSGCFLVLSHLKGSRLVKKTHSRKLPFGGWQVGRAGFQSWAIQHWRKQRILLSVKLQQVADHKLLTSNTSHCIQNDKKSSAQQDLINRSSFGLLWCHCYVLCVN